MSRTNGATGSNGFAVPRPPQSTAGEVDPMKNWDSVPLFMRSLPDESTAPEADNNTLAALQSLMFDDPPSEVAATLKAKANELFSERKFRDAVGFYTQAIDECGKGLEIDELRILWSNRAAANLELGNYGATLKDVSLILNAPTPYPDPPSPAWHKTTLKSLLRSARALSALDKLPEAIDALDRLRLLEKELEQESADVGSAVRVEVERKLRKKDRKRIEAEEKTRRTKELAKRIGEALVMRGVVLPRRLASQPIFHACPIDITPPHFDADALQPESRPTLPLSPPEDKSVPFIKWQAPPPSTPIIFPIFLLKPLASPPSRDLCLSFHTSATFGDTLVAMEEDPAEFNLYIATKKGRVLKVGAKLELGKVLKAAAGEVGSGDGWELKEGWALEMVGVPKNSKGDEWIKNWKEELKSS